MVGPFSDVYDRLKALGYTERYVRYDVLPLWWDDEAASLPSGRAEGMLIISRKLGVPIGYLAGQRDER